MAPGDAVRFTHGAYTGLAATVIILQPIGPTVNKESDSPLGLQ